MNALLAHAAEEYCMAIGAGGSYPTSRFSDALGRFRMMCPWLIPIVLLMLIAAAPFVATAQPRAKLWRIGYLSYSTEASPEAVLRKAFLDKLRTLGHIEGRNISIEYRYAGGRVEKLGELARELAALPFDVLVGGGVQASLALKDATRTIPIVSLSCDAVAAGLVPNLARPGGNVTGVSCLTPDMAAKRLQLLTELRPGLKRVAILWNAGNPTATRLVASAARRVSSVSVSATSLSSSHALASLPSFSWQRPRL